MKKPVKVVAALIENEDEEILCALRSPQMSMPNMWEFPGGKAEPGEDSFTALRREIFEELGCEINPINVFHENTHEYESLTIQLITIKSKVVKDIPTPSEHSKLLWLKRENLASLVWAPADVPALEKLIRE